MDISVRRDRGDAVGGNEINLAVRVLIADDDDQIRHLVSRLLKKEGYSCFEAADGEEVLSMAAHLKPDLILMDVAMPRLSGTEALARLRKDFRTRFVPVVLLTGASASPLKVATLRTGVDEYADDYILKPFGEEELVARVHLVLRRWQSWRELNPITGLPGNTAITEEISSRLREGLPFALLYADIDSFKAYNDHHGFSRGDMVIKALGRIILETLESRGSPEDFAGHIGGDDFVVLTDPARGEEIAEEIVARFDAEAPTWYRPEDRDRGWIEVQDRTRRAHRFPFVSVSIGIVLSQAHPFHSAAQVSDVAAEMKAAVKRIPGSAWAADRRRGVLVEAHDVAD
jgi:diguanylate cyclase (GGDEF)-like protein